MKTGPLNSMVIYFILFIVYLYNKCQVFTIFYTWNKTDHNGIIKSVAGIHDYQTGFPSKYDSVLI